MAGAALALLWSLAPALSLLILLRHTMKSRGRRRGGGPLHAAHEVARCLHRLVAAVEEDERQEQRAAVQVAYSLTRCVEASAAREEGGQLQPQPAYAALPLPPAAAEQHETLPAVFAAALPPPPVPGAPRPYSLACSGRGGHGAAAAGSSSGRQQGAGKVSAAVCFACCGGVRHDGELFGRRQAAHLASAAPPSQTVSSPPLQPAPPPSSSSLQPRPRSCGRARPRADALSTTAAGSRWPAHCAAAKTASTAATHALRAAAQRAQPARSSAA